jgi:hypothetical protein
MVGVIHVEAAKHLDSSFDLLLLDGEEAIPGIIELLQQDMGREYLSSFGISHLLIALKKAIIKLVIFNLLSTSRFSYLSNVVFLNHNIF